MNDFVMDFGFGMIALVVLAIVVIALLISCIKIVPQANAYVVERLGAYHATWSTGMHFKVPFIDRIAKKVSLKEQVIDFPPQPVITKDNVTMQIDTVIYFQITDSKLYAYGVERPISAIENLSATTLRNIIGDMELDHTLTSRDIINSKIRVILDEATDAWGIKVNRVELKNIIPPKEIQDSMEKQMKAERERRAKILDAEGEKRSAILIAEGQKESARPARGGRPRDEDPRGAGRGGSDPLGAARAGGVAQAAERIEPERGGARTQEPRGVRKGGRR